MTDSAYKPLTTAENIFKQLVWTPLMTSGQVFISGYLLAIPVVGPVLSAIEKVALGYLGDFIFDKLRLFLDVTAIKLVNEVHQAAYDSASLQLRLIADESGPDSDAFKQALAKEALAQSQFTAVFHQ